MTVTQIDGARQIRFTAALDLQTQKIINVVDPSSDQEAATKGYVDAQVAGGGVVDYKDSVFLATTADGTLGSDYENGDTIDGTVLTTGDRILIKNQGTGSENGIYTVNASGAPTRAGDANADAEVTAGMQVWVEAGTTNSDTGWIITTNGTITVDTTAIAFGRIGGSGDAHISDMTAGQGLVQSTNLIDVELTSNEGLKFTGGAPGGTLGVALEAAGAGTGGLSFDAGEIRIGLGTNSGMALAASGLEITDGSGLVASGANFDIDLGSASGLGFNSGLEIGDGSGLLATGGTLAVRLEAAGVDAGGLEFVTGQIAIDLATNSGLGLTATGLEVGDGSGLTATTGTLAVNLDTTSGLEFVSGALGVNDGSGLTRVGAGGLRADLAAAGAGTGGLAFVSGQVAVNLGTDSGMSLTASGVEVTDGSGLVASGANFDIDLGAASGLGFNSGLEIGDGSGLVATGGSLAVDLEPAAVGAGGLAFDAGQVRIDLAATGSGLTLLATGLAIDDTFFPAHWVIRHTPTGTIDGTVTDFTITDGVPVQDGTNGMESLYLNGILQAEGDSTTGDYTMGTTTVATIHTPPEVGDIIRLTYPKQYDGT